VIFDISPTTIVIDITTEFTGTAHPKWTPSHGDETTNNVWDDSDDSYHHLKCWVCEIARWYRYMMIYVYHCISYYMYNRIQTIIYDVEEFDKIKPLSKDRVVSPLPSWHFQCWNESWFRWLELTDDAHPPTLQTYFLYIYRRIRSNNLRSKFGELHTIGSMNSSVGPYVL
jgi:hypothetical protein